LHGRTTDLARWRQTARAARSARPASNTRREKAFFSRVGGWDRRSQNAPDSRMSANARRLADPISRASRTFSVAAPRSGMICLEQRTRLPFVGRLPCRNLMEICWPGLMACLALSNASLRTLPPPDETGTCSFWLVARGDRQLLRKSSLVRAESYLVDRPPGAFNGWPVGRLVKRVI
jgi:hypothetical protein